MDIFIVLGQLFINGLAMGLIYVLLASGFILILTIPRIFFIVYGEFYMVGAFTVWLGIVALKQQFILSLLLAMLVTSLLGAISYGLIFRYMQNKEQHFLACVVASVGLMMIVSQSALLVFGTEARGVPPVISGVLNFGAFVISVDKLVLILPGVSITIGLYLILQKTKIGRAMRAVSFRSDVAALQGVNTNAIYLATMIIGCVIAGFAGGIMAPVFAIAPNMGNIFLPVLVVVMLGGTGSMLGPVFGGLIMGITQAFGQYYIGTGVAQIMLCVVTGVILVFRPGGIFAQSETETWF